MSVVIDHADRGGVGASRSRTRQPVIDSTREAPHDVKIAVRAAADEVLSDFPVARPAGARADRLRGGGAKGRRAQWSSYRLPASDRGDPRAPAAPASADRDRRRGRRDGRRRGVRRTGAMWEWSWASCPSQGLDTHPDRRLAGEKGPAVRIPPGFGARVRRAASSTTSASRRTASASSSGSPAALRARPVSAVATCSCSVRSSTCEQFVEELGSRESRHVYKKNVVWEPTTEIARRVDELVPRLNREREMELVETVKESAYSRSAPHWDHRRRSRRSARAASRTCCSMPSVTIAVKA